MTEINDSLTQVINDVAPKIISDTMNNEVLWTSNEIWTLIIAGISLIFVIIIGFRQSFLSRKQLELSNRLEKYESKKGEVQLTLLICRYFIAFFNMWDMTNMKKAKVKTDKVSVSHYLSECKMILTNLNSLINNPFYVDLLEEHPELIQTLFQLNRDIIEQEQQSNLDVNKLALSSHSFYKFHDLFYILKKKHKELKIFKAKMIPDIENDIINNFKKVLPRP